MIELAQPLATVVAGGGVVTAAVLVSRRAALNRQVDISHHEEMRGHHRDRLRAERYSACSEQLGHTSPAVRMAGIYGMLSLADDWVSSGNDSEAQTAIDVIRRYNCGRPPQDLADLRSEMFVRKVVIEELSLRSSWWTRARGVAPPKTNVPHLSRLSRWSHLKTDLKSSVLPSIDLRHGRLAGVDLSRSDLSNADLSRSDFEAANFTDASLLNASCGEMYARYAYFENADFSGADLSNATLTNVNMDSANMSGADLRGANLMGSDLLEVNFDGADVDGTEFTEDQFEDREDLKSLVRRGARVAPAHRAHATIIRMGNSSSTETEVDGPIHSD
ncbi:pentapeptide repeat-containing protein [Rhodococcus artemisiae]|uniref:Pentapeptide repeat-containing protein n=1 Tax=Rhodococcus artemisiae TaxID=714159 RepID=A0ABU7L3L1_9NOCA|nr:pentapeptide repeat-containing protein [Rhodococcus artemisiae]MEE2055927.1 pentapeptide repeat-containing protein [Rhodococcus artemisiae]